jgi:hypothetical protein
MGRERIEHLHDYLMKLAPIFFSTQTKGASQKDISELEQIANRTFCESYNTFLRIFGRTPAQDLNPFINDRDFEIETIKEAYKIAHEDCQETGRYCMPESIIYFSSSDILGEEIHLRQPKDPIGDPEIGYLDWETGDLNLNSSRTFEEWLFYLAFDFRLAQFDFMRRFEAPWNKIEQIWEGQPEYYMKIMADLGFEIVFQLAGGVVCHERGDVAALTHLESTSGRIAGDDERKVERISGLLAYHLNSSITHTPGRLRAPKK